LDNKEVMKYHKRYETYVGSKTTESMIENFLTLSIKAVGLVIKIDNSDALKNELKNNFIVHKELSQFFGGLGLKYGGKLAVVNTAMITAKHVNFSNEQITEQITKQITKQSSVIIEELESNTE